MWVLLDIWNFDIEKFVFFSFFKKIEFCLNQVTVYKLCHVRDYDMKYWFVNPYYLFQ